MNCVVFSVTLMHNNKQYIYNLTEINYLWLVRLKDQDHITRES